MAKNNKTMLNSSKPETLDEEYARLQEEMKGVPADYSIFTKIRRKVRSLLQLPESNGGVTSRRRLNLERRMDEIENEMTK